MTDKILSATHGSADHPLRIGNIEIPCYVLENEARVITQRGLQTAIGMSKSGGTFGAHRMARFIENLRDHPNMAASLTLKDDKDGFNWSDLVERINNPISFRARGVGRLSYGYEATILADLCDAILQARDVKALHVQQQGFAKQCEILVRGFARVGITALVDEATGYQELRDKKALARILAKYISGELLEWARMFPDEFYKELFRLRGWEYHNMSMKRPILVGKLTVDLVYRRLAPGVYTKLKEVNPKNEKGRLRHTYTRWLTDDEGKPALDRHLHTLTALMRASSSWDGFMRLTNRSLPRYSENIALPGVDWSECNDSEPEDTQPA